MRHRKAADQGHARAQFRLRRYMAMARECRSDEPHAVERSIFAAAFALLLPCIALAQSASVEADANLADPAKLATLGVRGANPRVQKITCWLATAQTNGEKPEADIVAVLGRFGWAETTKGELTKAAMLRNLDIAEKLGGLLNFSEGAEASAQRGRHERGHLQGKSRSIALPFWANGITETALGMEKDFMTEGTYENDFANAQ